MYLGIDLGTSELKVAAAGRGAAHRRGGRAHRLTSSRPQPLWSEQAPAELVAGTGQGDAAAAPKRPRRSGTGARRSGLSGQMHGAVLLDAGQRGAAAGDSVERRPQRSPSATQLEARRAALARHHRQPGDARLHRAQTAVGAPARTGRVRANPHACCCPRTGCGCGSPARRSATCPTRPARSGSTWARGDWSRRTAAGLRPDAGAYAASGRGQRAVRPTAARARAARGGCPPVCRSPAARATTPPARSAWAWSAPGEGFVSLGTSGVIFRRSERLSPGPAQAVHAFCHALPGRWHQMSVMLWPRARWPGPRA